MENKDSTQELITEQEVKDILSLKEPIKQEQELSEETKKILFEKLQKEFNSMDRRTKRKFRPYKFSNYIKAKFAQQNLNKHK